MTNFVKGLGRTFNLLMVLSILLTFNACTRIGPGHEGLKVSLAGGDKGSARIQPVFGWITYMPWTTQVVEVDVRNQHFEIKEPITVQAKGGTNVVVHPSFNYRITAGHLDSLYLNWGVKDDQQIQGKLLETSLLTALREETNTFSIDSLLNNRAAYDAALEQTMNKKLAPYVQLFQFTSGVTPDPSMAQAIADKAGSIQRAITAENKRRETQALADLEIINARKDSSVTMINATAEAKAIFVKQEALKQSPQYVELVKAQAWDGKLPQYVLGNTGMFMNLGK